jgi:hypothetical protein
MLSEALVERVCCDSTENPLSEAIRPRHGRIRIALPRGLGPGVYTDPRMIETLRVS